ncbi:hypothetical protein [Actinocorallia libanotica]|uniref:LysR substrate binding domain-containing protein n=1 Tax=Actinocorallia libanotica TaxID=46162 RepID=A0ABN1S026_9ACTN
MTPAKAVIKNGELLLPHEVGCGAELISPDDPRYEALYATAFHDEKDDREKSAALLSEWLAKWALEDRRTA